VRYDFSQWEVRGDQDEPWVPFTVRNEPRSRETREEDAMIKSSGALPSIFLALKSRHPGASNSCDQKILVYEGKSSIVERA
jgi:hypothetical protein